MGGGDSGGKYYEHRNDAAYPYLPGIPESASTELQKRRIVGGCRLFLGCILGVIVVGAICGVSSVVSEKLRSGSDPEFIRSLFGAFFGAFFVFLFLRLSDEIRRQGDRMRRHRAALVKLQHILTGYKAQILNTRHLLDGAMKRDQDVVGKEVRVDSTRFSEISIERDILIDLQNIDLMNDLFRLNLELDRLNKDVLGFNRISDNSQKRLFANMGGEAVAEFQANATVLREQYKVIDLVYEEAEKDTSKNLAAVCVLCRKKPIISELLSLFREEAYGEATKAEIEREYERILREDRLATDARAAKLAKALRQG